MSDLSGYAKQELSGYIAFDVETTIAEYMKRKASPFSGDNWVVAAAYRVNGKGEVHSNYWGKASKGSHGWLASMLYEHWPKFLVGFNIKFDLLWTTISKEDHDAFMAWVAAGGQVWDAQLAEYLLDGMVQEAQMLSLDEVAPRYGGELKIDEVKAFWARGISTEHIPQQLLMDYLTGRVENGEVVGGDIHNTELIFLGQTKAAALRKQTRSIQLNNGALIATYEMERNGLFVDIAAGRKQAAVLDAEQLRLKEALKDYLPKDMPFEFNWRSRKQLSAFIFGGRVPYKQRVHQMDSMGNPAFSRKKVEAYDVGEGQFISVPSFRPEDWEVDPRVVYGSGKKKGQHKTKQIEVPDYERPKMKIEDFHYTMAGLTKPLKKWEGAEAGVYSTSGEVIEELGLTTDIPFLKDFANLQAIVKDLGTYYIIEEFDEEGNLTKAKGMLTLVQPDGTVHHTLNMTSTVTARFSHANPNSGNLPRGDDNSATGGHTSLVKEMFISRYGAEGTMISSDFKSLEVYCQANLSHDKQLVSDLRAGLDMHVARLSTVEGMPYDKLLLLAKGDKRRNILAVPEWDVKRTKIKVFSFQRAYGAGATKVSQYLKVPKEDVEAWIAADDKRYPGVVLFNEKVAMTVAASRVPTTRYVPHPTEKVPVMLGRGHLTTFDGKRYVFSESTTPDYLAKRGTLASFSPTELKNYPVQGLGGEWMKAAMWLAVRLFYSYKNFGGLGHLINTVHDALYGDAHKSVERKVGIAIHASMLAASDFMEYWFSHTIDVPVPSETTYGDSMADAAEFDDPDSFDRDSGKVRQWLRKTYMNNYQPSFI